MVSSGPGSEPGSGSRGSEGGFASGADAPAPGERTQLQNNCVFCLFFYPSKQDGDAKQSQLFFVLRFLLSSISLSAALHYFVSYSARDLTELGVLLKGS